MHLIDLDQFLFEMLKTSAEAAGAQAGAVVLLADEGRSYRFAAVLARGGQRVLPGASRLATRPMTSELERWLSEMVSSSGPWPAAPKGVENAAHTMALPMRAGDRLVGWLSLGFDQFKPEPVEAPVLLQMLANYIATAVETLRVSEQAKPSGLAQQRGVELPKVNAMLRRGLKLLAEESPMEALPGLLLTEAASALGAEDGAILLNEPGTAVVQRPGAILQAGRLLRPEELAAVALTDQTNTRSTIEQLIGPTERQKIWHAPLRVRGEPLGSIGIASPNEHPLTASQQESAEAMAQQVALAVQFGRLAEHAAELTTAIEALRQSSGGLSTVNELPDFLQQLTRSAIEVTGAACGKVVLLAPDGKGLTVVARVSDDLPKDVLDEEADLNNTRGRIWERLAGQPGQWWASLADANLSAALAAHHRQQGHTDIARIPIRIRGELVGFLEVAFRTPPALSKTRRDILDILAEQAALAISVTRVVHPVEEQRLLNIVKANTLLRKVSARLVENADLQSFLRYLLMAAATEAEAGDVTLFLLTPQADALRMAYYFRGGQELDLATDDRLTFWHQPLPLSDLDNIWKAWSKSPEYVVAHSNATSLLANAIVPWHRQMGHRTVVLVPLTWAASPIGFIGLFYEQVLEPQQEAMELVRALTQQATLAIQMTKLADQVNEYALTEERNRLAEQVHDALAQGFAAIGMQVKAIGRSGIALPPDVKTNLDIVSDLAQANLQEARRSIHALRPTSNASGNLAAGLTNMVNRSRRLTTAVLKLTLGNLPRLRRPTEENLIRMAQEALMNAVQYSHATTITVSALTFPGMVRLSVQDDGVGFDPDQTKDGFGLGNMYQRAAKIKAELTIASNRGSGTEIIISVPNPEDGTASHAG